MQIDLRLIPQLKPFVVHRLRNVDGQARRWRNWKKIRKDFLQIAIAERRPQRLKHGKAKLFAEILQCRQHQGCAAAKQHRLAGETPRREHVKYLRDIALRLEQPQYDEIGRDPRHRCIDIRNPCAVLCNEAKVLERLRQKGPDMRFFVYDADSRDSSSLTELL